MMIASHSLLGCVCAVADSDFPEQPYLQSTGSAASTRRESAAATCIVHAEARCADATRRLARERAVPG
jgi:hypothetical protein